MKPFWQMTIRGELRKRAQTVIRIYGRRAKHAETVMSIYDRRAQRAETVMSIQAMRAEAVMINSGWASEGEPRR